ncbi:MAG: Validamycin A dioxygenase [Chlamydiia bacterium]|nr:Validamycin A dioxygenase [Chlamydiia bacterium]MCH9615773.1 Validamycin A dioxygenase [Chlamydiia bacterium]MCH9628824.1 Validamycin A dioxygenase [Chlamydiia bacterium]
MKFLACLLATGAIFGATIPVVDMEDFRNNETREQFVEGLKKAFHDVGFVAVTNTGFDTEILDNTFASMEEFFARDFATKNEANGAHNGFQRGYCPFDTEEPKGGDACDNKEYLHVGRSGNIWPESADYEEVAQKYFDELYRFCTEFDHAISLGLEQEAGFINEMTHDGENLLRVLHYPNRKEAGTWAGAHTDIDLYAIIPRATADGLEVQMNDGSWVGVKVPKDAFIINCGDMLRNMSNGYYKSAVHRVVSGENSDERFSMVLFVHPRSECMMSPLQSCIKMTGGEKTYADCNRWEMLMERLADINQAPEWMLQELASTGFMERQVAVGRQSEDAINRLKEAGLWNDG